MGKKIGNNQNDTNVVLNSGQYMPRAMYVNKFGREMSECPIMFKRCYRSQLKYGR